MTDQSKLVTIYIDGTPLQVEEDTTIIDALELSGSTTPVICFHEATTPEGLCRLCVVEVEGWRTLAPACVTKINKDMRIKTQSSRVLRSRKTILEMLNASVDLSEAPEIQEYMQEYAIDTRRFPSAQPRKKEPIDDNPFYIRDYTKCLLCWRCVQACGDDLQFTYALSIGGRGYETKIATFFKASMPETTCVFCGNCVAVCPTNALVGKTEFLLDQGHDYDTIRQMKRTGRKPKEVQK